MYRKPTRGTFSLRVLFEMAGEEEGQLGAFSDSEPAGFDPSVWLPSLYW